MDISQRPPSTEVPTSQAHAKRMVRIGWWIILTAIVPIGAWVSLAPLSMAVVAPGFVKVDLNRRPVQHLEGGIVHSVLVRDGQRVKAGEPVLLLRDVGIDADRNRLAYRVDVERASICRLRPSRRWRAGLSSPMTCWRRPSRTNASSRRCRRRPSCSRIGRASCRERV